MAIIRVETMIAAPLERCFDLARDLRIHEQTTANSGERVVEVLRSSAASSDALLELGDEVTFEAKHLGVRQRLTSKVVEFDRPHSFTDEMQRGAFKCLRHVHRFESTENGTKMIDILDFASPLGPLGSLFDKVLLAGYMKRFITRRGDALKSIAER